MGGFDCSDDLRPRACVHVLKQLKICTMENGRIKSTEMIITNLWKVQEESYMQKTWIAHRNSDCINATFCHPCPIFFCYPCVPVSFEDMFSVHAASYIEVTLSRLRCMLKRAVSNPAFENEPGPWWDAALVRKGGDWGEENIVPRLTPFCFR
jgi:hypothetical protein